MYSSPRGQIHIYYELLVVCLCTSVALGLLNLPVIALVLTKTEATTHRHHLDSPRDAQPAPGLRILPIGDSITAGFRSTNGNGYRLKLLELLVDNVAVHITYVGSAQSGSMINNHHEGHTGYKIIPIGDLSRPSFASQPHVVLLMAGTNDVGGDDDTANAPMRLGNLAREITESCPNASVLVGTLIPMLNPVWNSRIIIFNEQIPLVIENLAKEGKKVDLVPMNSVTEDHVRSDDGIHPTDEGYELIAAAWYDGIMKAAKKGWIEKPLGLPVAPVEPGNTAAVGTIAEKISKLGLSRGTKKSELVLSSNNLFSYLIIGVLLFGSVIIVKKFVVMLLSSWGYARTSWSNYQVRTPADYEEIALRDCR